LTSEEKKINKIFDFVTRQDGQAEGGEREAGGEGEVVVEGAGFPQKHISCTRRSVFETFKYHY
jgi:hypothetical protein